MAKKWDKNKIPNHIPLLILFLFTLIVFFIIYLPFYSPFVIIESFPINIFIIQALLLAPIILTVVIIYDKNSSKNLIIPYLEISQAILTGLILVVITLGFGIFIF